MSNQRLKPVLIVALFVVVVTVLVVVVVRWGADSVQESAPPSSPTAIQAEPSQNEPSSDQTPVIAEPCVKLKGFKKRVCEFELANLIPDETVRCQALKQYVTPAYLEGLPCSGGRSDMQATIAELTIQYDPDEDGVLFVTSRFSILTLREGQVENVIRDQEHLTDWVKQDKTWVVLQDGVAESLPAT